MADRKNKITMADIARASQLSLSTVSLVINEKPGIPQETRNKVLNTAHELGYDFGSPTINLPQPSKIRTIGMLVKRAQGDSAPPSSNIFFSHVMAGIEAGCRQENITLLYSTLPVDENNNSLEIPRLVYDTQINGLLLVGNYVDERLHQALKQRPVPVILVEAYCSSGNYDSILIQNFQGAYRATKRLIEYGHQHIAFLGSYPDSRLSFRDRRMGYQQALSDTGIAYTYFGDCPHNNREAIISTTTRLLKENPQITAIIGCNDEVSVIAMHGIMNAGKCVPQDISIIGFDNNSNAENSIPPLTTINVDKVTMGRLAVQLLLNRAENPEQGIVNMYLHTNLVERSSVCRRPS